MQHRRYYWLKDRKFGVLTIGAIKKNTCHDPMSWVISIEEPISTEHFKENYKIIKRIPFPNGKVK